MEHNNNTDINNNIAINWNTIIGQEARSVDDNADLGKIQGLFEPFIVTERGTINKEKFYIPKSLIIRYNDEMLYFDITEQQAKDYCMRTTPPSEYEAEGIVQILSERRRSREEEGKKVEEETEIVPVREEKQEGKGTKMLEKIPLTTTLSKVDINEEEIGNKLKAAASEFKDRIISGTKVAKQKIKQTQEIVEKKQANRDAEKISKMGSLATQFTSSFDDILSDIKTRTYEEQEEIYTGFIKLIEQQRDLLIARRGLAAKLKDSVQKPVVDATTTEKPLIRGVKKQRQLESASQDPQLPEIIAATTTGEDESKIKPQIITAAEKESSEEMTASDKSSPGSRSTTASVKNKKANRSSSTKTSSTTAKTSKVKKNNR
jgi:hypothetical protein